MKAQGLALGLVLLLTGCATNTSGVALYGAAGAAAVAEQHQNVNVTLTELSRRQQNGLLQVNVAAASTQRGDNRLQYLFYWYDDAGQEVASDGLQVGGAVIDGHRLGLGGIAIADGGAGAAAQQQGAGQDQQGMIHFHQ